MEITVKHYVNRKWIYLSSVLILHGNNKLTSLAGIISFRASPETMVTDLQPDVTLSSCMYECRHMCAAAQPGGCVGGNSECDSEGQTQHEHMTAVSTLKCIKVCTLAVLLLWALISPKPKRTKELWALHLHCWEYKHVQKSCVGFDSSLPVYKICRWVFAWERWKSCVLSAQQSSCTGICVCFYTCASC